MGTVRVSGAVLLRVTDGRRFALLSDQRNDRNVGLIAATMLVTPEGRRDLWERFSVTPKDFLDDEGKLKLSIREDDFADFCQWVYEGEGIYSFAENAKFQEKLDLCNLRPVLLRLRPWKYARYDAPLRGRQSVWMYILFKIYEIRLRPQELSRLAGSQPMLEIVGAHDIRTGKSPRGRMIADACRVLL